MPETDPNFIYLCQPEGSKQHHSFSVKSEVAELKIDSKENREGKKRRQRRNNSN